MKVFYADHLLTHLKTHSREKSNSVTIGDFGDYSIFLILVNLIILVNFVINMTLVNVVNLANLVDLVNLIMLVNLEILVVLGGGKQEPPFLSPRTRKTA